MGTGGNIPNKIVQSVTLFNTTGVIEEGKGIYFCPLMKKVSGKPEKVNEYWIDRLKTEVSGVDSSYTDINISTWSPQDRTLTLKGNIDDFRCVTTIGKCLNYLILKRDVYSSENVYVRHYYGFFIKDAKQAGGASITLSLTPDDFSNVFYLFVSDTLSQYNYYDSFNAKMGKFYVERQHYDRVRVTGGVIEVEVELEEGEGSFLLSDYISKPESSAVVNIETSGYEIDNIERLDDGDIRVDVYNVSSPETATVTLDFNVVTLEENNMEIFSNVEETFKYRRQFRDEKRPMGVSFTDAEMTTIKNTNTWNSLSSDLKIKCLKYCCAFLHVVLKDNKMLLNYDSEGEAPSSESSWGNYGEETVSFMKKTSGITEKLYKLCCPIAIIPDFLKKFKNNIDTIYNTAFGVKIYVNAQTITQPFYYTNLKRMIYSPVFANYIVSAYITKESFISEKLVFSGSDILITVESPEYNSYYFESGGRPKIVTFCSYENSDEYDVEESKVLELLSKHAVNYNFSTSTIFATLGKPEDYTDLAPAIKTAGAMNTYHDLNIAILEEVEEISGSVDLTPKIYYDKVKSNFYDPVLTFEPYSFYSVSYLGNIEVPLNKKNYYQNYVIDYDLLVSVSDTIKYSWIPTYTINGKSFKYYTESLTFTLANHLTITSEKLMDYVIANQTQMKNQFAVQERSAIQGFATSGTQAIGGILGSGITSGASGAEGSGFKGLFGAISSLVSIPFEKANLRDQQKAKLADLGAMPDNVKQTGSDIYSDIMFEEIGLYLNHYTIDEVSYNSIAQYLERFGYAVNIYTTFLNVNNRAGYNFVKLIGFEFTNANLNQEQENNIRQIFSNGVTLLHDRSYLYQNKHNIETALKEVN